MNLDRIRAFLDDLWFDLRERRLLPAVVALGVAIVAVPLVLGGSDEVAPPASQPAPSVIETQPAVSVASEDGVRDADERLSGRDPKNPFRQQLQSLPNSGEIAEEGAAQDATQAAAAADQLADQLTGVAGGVASDEPSGDGGDTGAVTDTDATQPGDSTTTKTKTITKKIVKLEQRRLRVRFGQQGERNKVKGLESLDVLPRDGDPVLVLLGVNEEGRAMFDVSSRVKSVWGDGKCSPAKDACDYIQLKPGQTAKLRYQPTNEAKASVVYSLTVVRVSTKRIDAE
jgi:hypothetical protein